MTVFNHFPRKEDMFFDLDDQGREDLLHALQQATPDTCPLEALRRFAHQAVEEQRPYVHFFAAGNGRFMATIQASEALKARARAIRDELTATLAIALARSTNRVPDTTATLAASLLVATWAVALTEAHRVFQHDQDSDKANAVFLALIDRGTKGVRAAMEGTPYT